MDWSECYYLLLFSFSFYYYFKIWLQALQAAKNGNQFFFRLLGTDKALFFHLRVKPKLKTNRA